MSDAVDVDVIPALLQAAQMSRCWLLGAQPIACEKTDLVFHRRESLPDHANGMRFEAFDEASAAGRTQPLLVGGGFVVMTRWRPTVGRPEGGGADTTGAAASTHRRRTSLALSEREGTAASPNLMRRNERHWRSDAEIDAGLLKITRT